MDTLTTQLWPVIGVAFAMALGGAVGYERELKNRPAGFRTHMLVAGAATLLVELGELLLFDTHYRLLSGINVDPLRLVEAVVSGVAFIGAGTIFATRNGETVAGITTAASVGLPQIVSHSARRSAAGSRPSAFASGKVTFARLMSSPFDLRSP